MDWEISSSIRDTEYNPRSGLLGILLPTYPSYHQEREYSKYTVPPRLADNVFVEYAKIYKWTEDPISIQRWVHEAYNRKKTILPDNSYSSFVNNRSGERWY